MIKKFEEDALKISIDKRSKYLRQLVVNCLISANRGHMGSAMSLIEILRVLYDEIIIFDPSNINLANRDRVILSKGHGCLALYAILADKKFINISELDSVGQLNSILGGHPESFKIPGVEASTGALGHGMPIALGMAVAAKIKKEKHNVYVIVGDGEINEGSVWEAALSAKKHKLNNLKVIIDYNKIQSYSFTSEVLDLEPLKDKWESFGFEVSEVNGHDVVALKNNFTSFNKFKNEKPSVTICHTIKGKGFYFAENNPLWHHKNSFTTEEIKNLNESLR
jgi:transketolase